MNVPFGDLRREYKELSEEINSAFQEVCERGWFILGKKVEEFENAFAEYIGNNVSAVGVGSGTEALHLSLIASGVEHNDYVITAPNTAVPTVSAISFAGAIPLFADIDQNTFNIDPNVLRSTVKKEKSRLGNKLKAVIPVHLYGQSADMDAILEIAREFDMKVIEDACQSHGAEYNGIKVGSFGDYAAFSFYPSKNLGAYGDGGCILTKDPAEAQRLRMLRNYGQKKRYFHQIKGFNSRLDEIQASILLIKLKRLDQWNQQRENIAYYYNNLLRNTQITTPIEANNSRHVYHLYVIRNNRRDELQQFLKDKGIETLIHYPIPIHLQQAYLDLGYSKGSFPIAEETASEILSLPLYPGIKQEELQAVCEAIEAFFRKE